MGNSFKFGTVVEEEHFTDRVRYGKRSKTELVIIRYMRKMQEEIRNMTEDEFWEYINSSNPRPVNKGDEPLHFKTKEEWRAYYSDGHEISEFMEIIGSKYGV